MSETAIKERPILFSAPMVRAILEGRKTQTRRMVKHEARGADRVFWTDKGELWPGRGEPYVGWLAQVDKLNGLHLPLTCPYGAVGDRLWVRESTVCIPTGPTLVGYVADGCKKTESFERLRPGIHMLRGWCRIRLEVVGVRVERLMEISEEDGIAEGFAASHTEEECSVPIGSGLTIGRVGTSISAAGHFLMLWDQIHGDGATYANPFVWVIEFRRISQ